MTNHGTATYTYDGLDRVASANGAGATYAGGEIDPVTYGTSLFGRTPAGELTSLRNGSTNTVAFENRHGDVTFTVNQAGALTNTRLYNPYGETVGSTGTTLPVGYQGDITDPTTGLVWMGARWYRPSTGTFTSRDTVFGMLQTPVSLRSTHRVGEGATELSSTDATETSARPLADSRQRPDLGCGHSCRSSHRCSVSVVHVATPVPRKSLSFVQTSPSRASADATTGQSAGSRSDRALASSSDAA
jgi:RHS repeat-associated protein